MFDGSESKRTCMNGEVTFVASTWFNPFLGIEKPTCCNMILYQSISMIIKQVCKHRGNVLCTSTLRLDDPVGQENRCSMCCWRPSIWSILWGICSCCSFTSPALAGHHMVIIPSGKRLHNYGKSQLFIGKFTINDDFP